MKERNGFTLVELLVVIIIIGIITVLALPGIGQLQTRNRNKKFEAYSDSMESAGKLYTDSYSDDMFGMEGSGCYDIPYPELRGKSLIRDYEVDGINCNHNKTFVQVRKENTKYSYAVSLYCTKNGEVVYDKTLTSCITNNEGVTDVPSIDISYRNKYNLSGDWSNTKDVTIKVTAVEGLVDNITIRYGWSTSPSVTPTSMKTYNYRNEFGKQSATMTFEDSGKNGEYYLFVEGDDIIDTGGRFAQDRWSAVMKFDSTPPAVPVLNNPRNNTWTGIEFVNASKYVIGATSSDNLSGVAYYQYRYPGSQPAWTKYANSIGNNFTTTPFTVERDENVEIRACDYANNCSGGASSRIKIDMTKPVCNISRSIPNPNGKNNWYITNVDILMEVIEPSSVASPVSYELTTSTSPVYSKMNKKETQKNTTGVVWRGYARDEAGNVNSCVDPSNTINVDTDIPTCSIGIDERQIYVSDHHDTTSGIDTTAFSWSTGAKANSIGILAGTHILYTYDRAGNRGSSSITVINTTPVNVCDGYEDENGCFYKEDATEYYTCPSGYSDNGSNCTKTVSATPNYYCNTGATCHLMFTAANQMACSKDGWNCYMAPTTASGRCECSRKNYITKYTCDSGSLSDTNCITTASYDTKYKCSSGTLIQEKYCRISKSYDTEYRCSSDYTKLNDSYCYAY